MIECFVPAAAAIAARFSTSFMSVARIARGGGVISLIFTTLLIASEMGGVKEAKWEWAINNDSIILAARSMQGSNFHDSDHRLLLQSTFQQRERRGEEESCASIADKLTSWSWTRGGRGRTARACGGDATSGGGRSKRQKEDLRRGKLSITATPPAGEMLRAKEEEEGEVVLR